MLNVLIISYYEPNFIEKSFKKVVFQFFAKIEMRRNENQSFGCHFETLHFFFYFFPWICLFLVYEYIVYTTKTMVLKITPRVLNLTPAVLNLTPAQLQ